MAHASASQAVARAAQNLRGGVLGGAAQRVRPLSRVAERADQPQVDEAQVPLAV